MMLVAIRSPLLLRFFWGQREVYPSRVEAHPLLWWRWFWRARKEARCGVVYAAPGFSQRERTEDRVERAFASDGSAIEHRRLTFDEWAMLDAKREHFRRKREWAKADAIRAYIEASGIPVYDAAVGQQHG